MTCLMVFLYFLFFPITITAALLYLVVCIIFNQPYSFEQVWGATLLVSIIAGLLRKL